MFEKVNFNELSDEKLLKLKKSYKNYLVTFGITFVVLVLAILYGSIYKNHKIFIGQNIFVTILIFSFMFSNYSNIQKVNKELNYPRL